MFSLFKLQEPFNLAAGQFLVATPKLDRDEAFRQAVILFMGMDKYGGCWGVDLTKLMDESESSMKAFDGGPCSERAVTVIFDKVHDGLMSIGDLDLSFASPLTYDASPTWPNGHDLGRVHLFFGYAGWTGRKLNSELQNGFWELVPATKELVFDTPSSDLWSVCAERAGVHPAAGGPSPLPR